jgi:PKD repeat protein
VSFDSNASYDPDAQPLGFLWNFGDGTTSTQRNPSHVYTTAGVYDAALTVTEQTAPGASSTATVRITAGNNPPLASIATPEDGASYRVDDVIEFSGTATSGPTPIPASQLDWELRVLHNQHVHYDALPSAPDPGDPFLSVGGFTVDDHGDDVRFQLCLTATVLPENLTDTQCVDLFPEKTAITLATDPVGLQISYEDEGLTLAGPALIYPVVNSLQTISVLPVQQHRSFVQWQDGPTSTSRSFTVGTQPQTFTALYQNQPPTAQIAPATATGPAPLTVAFQGTGSTDPEGDALAYAWDAGAAGTSTAASPSFSFTSPGTHVVTLTVTDQLGATDVASASVAAAVAGAPACGDAIDNDGDGLADYPDDPGCYLASSTNEAPECDDGLDNDGDGKRDWDGAGVGEPDYQCRTAWRTSEAARGSCGLGFELALLAPLALRLRRLRRRGA